MAVAVAVSEAMVSEAVGGRENRESKIRQKCVPSRLYREACRWTLIIAFRRWKRFAIIHSRERKAICLAHLDKSAVVDVVLPQRFILIFGQVSAER